MLADTRLSMALQSIGADLACIGPEAEASIDGDWFCDVVVSSTPCIDVAVHLARPAAVGWVEPISRRLLRHQAVLICLPIALAVITTVVHTMGPQFRRWRECCAMASAASSTVNARMKWRAQPPQEPCCKSSMYVLTRCCNGGHTPLYTRFRARRSTLGFPLRSWISSGGGRRLRSWTTRQYWTPACHQT